MAPILASYFVVMRQCGAGLEAIVDPELIRSDVVARIKSGEYDNIEYIHHCDFGALKDVTDELMDEAQADDEPVRSHPVYVSWDHAQDHRKHAVL